METGSAVVEKFESHNLRDFLRIKDEDHHSRINQRIAANGVLGRSSVSGVTLGAILSDRSRPAQPADGPLPRVLPIRTLLDIIRDDRNTQRGDRRSWLQLKEKLRLRRGAGGSWASTVPVPTSSNIPINSNTSNPATIRNPSSFSDPTESTQSPFVSSSSSLQTNTSRTTDRTSRRFEPTNSLATEDGEAPNSRSENAAEEAQEGDQYEQQPARMSLMALLEETDRQLGFDGPRYTAGHEEEEEVVVVEQESDGVCGGGGELQNNCCVCMIRHKGAAFIPCGHTFCRLCCRELLAQRGNCPLCNNHILEILDIF